MDKHCDITNVKMEKDLKKWFWSFFLGQALIFGFWAVWFSATISTKVNQHQVDILEIRQDVRLKTDREMVFQIKADIERQNTQILEELKYIKQRIDNRHP